MGVGSNGSRNSGRSRLPESNALGVCKCSFDHSVGLYKFVLIDVVYIILYLLL